MLKQYEGEHCKLIKKDRLPHIVSTLRLVLPLVFSICVEPSSSSLAAKLLVYERSRPLWGGINYLISLFLRTLTAEVTQV